MHEYTAGNQSYSELIKNYDQKWVISREKMGTTG